LSVEFLVVSLRRTAHGPRITLHASPRTQDASRIALAASTLLPIYASTWVQAGGGGARSFEC